MPPWAQALCERFHGGEAHQVDLHAELGKLHGAGQTGEAAADHQDTLFTHRRCSGRLSLIGLWCVSRPAHSAVGFFGGLVVSHVVRPLM